MNEMRFESVAEYEREKQYSISEASDRVLKYIFFGAVSWFFPWFPSWVGITLTMLFTTLAFFLLLEILALYGNTEIQRFLSWVNDSDMGASHWELKPEGYDD